MSSTVCKLFYNKKNDLISPKSVQSSTIVVKNNKINRLVINGQTIINNQTFSDLYKPLKDRHIEILLTSLIEAKTKNDAQKINNISKKIIDRLEMNKVSQMVYKNKIAQINDKPKINHTITKVCVGVIVLAIFAGIIGGGALLTNLHVIPIAIGIDKIPMIMNIGLVSFSSIVMLSYIGAKIIASKNKDGKIAQLVKDLNLTIRNLYLFSNLNDATGTIVYIIAAILLFATLSHGATMWLALASKCVAYPTGILLIASGFQQFYESITELRNSYKTKNLINLIRSFSVIAMGVIFIIGLQTSPLGMAANLIMNLLPFIVIGMTMIVVRKQLNEIKEVSKKDSNDKGLFLENNLSLTDEELENLKTEILAWDQKQMLSWIKKQTSALDSFKKKLFKTENENTEFWHKIEKELESQATLDRLQEIKQMIIRQETKVKMEKKIEAFSGKLALETLKTVLEILQTKEDNKDIESSNNKIDEVFKNVLKESTQKYRVEWTKLCVNGSFLGTAGLIKFPGIYSVIQAFLNTINIGINLTPRFRNVPTAFLERPISLKKFHENSNPILAT